ncbi:MAG: acyltransferase [Nitrospinales bacterium]
MLHKAARLLRILGKGILFRELIKSGTYYLYEHVLPLENLKVGSNPEIHPTVSFRFEKNIVLGNNVVLDAHCCLWASEHSRIVIGDNTGIGPGSVAVSSNHSFPKGRVYTEEPLKESDISIGSNVWIGANSTLLAGAHIGDGCIIGAGCVIYRDIPKNSVVVSGSRKLSIVERR